MTDFLSWPIKFTDVFKRLFFWKCFFEKTAFFWEGKKTVFLKKDHFFWMKTVFFENLPILEIYRSLKNTDQIYRLGCKNLPFGIQNFTDKIYRHPFNSPMKIYRPLNIYRSSVFNRFLHFSNCFDGHFCSPQAFLDNSEAL